MAVLTYLRMPAKLENLGRLIGSVSYSAKTQGFEQEKVCRKESTKTGLFPTRSLKLMMYTSNNFLTFRTSGGSKPSLTENE